ncbi:hypothetical protein DB345_11245 [Spartobacteria bacterium LR76]|nr:hypothetical protein DB345_11245 [Spartobacteria bacterium LR76]
MGVDGAAALVIPSRESVKRFQTCWGDSLKRTIIYPNPATATAISTIKNLPNPPPPRGERLIGPELLRDADRGICDDVFAKGLGIAFTIETAGIEGTVNGC